MKTFKKLIETALPLDAINAASAREKSIRHGHPSTLHLWWARRPLAAARAVIFAQMVDDPSAHPERFPTEAAVVAERERLFEIIRDLVLWENTTNEAVLQRARNEIRRSWADTCAANADHPRAAELFNPEVLPAFHDPFAGGGALPLEAQRLGLEAYASDLNPVAVLINKAMIEIPPKFAGRPPVNPTARRDLFSPQRRQGKRFTTEDTESTEEEGEENNGILPPLPSASSVPSVVDSSPLWPGAAGLAEDVRYYGQWMRDEAEQRIGHLYPKIRITTEDTESTEEGNAPQRTQSAQSRKEAENKVVPAPLPSVSSVSSVVNLSERPDLKPYVGRELTVIAWLWARTVRSPNPAFAHADVPLASTFMLSTKPGKEAYVAPVIEGDSYRFTVRVGKPQDPEAAKNGTKLSRGANFRCLLSGAPIAPAHVYAEANAGRMGARLMAIVAEGDHGRVYLAPTAAMEQIALQAQPTWKPEVPMPENPRWFSPPLYGLKTYGDLFTPRQLVALTTFSDLVLAARARAQADAAAAGLPDDGRGLDDGGTGAAAYADAVGVYLGLAVSRTTNTINALAVWSQSREQSVNLFSRQAIPMAWDFPEVNPFAGAAGDFGATTSSMGKTVSNALGGQAYVSQADAQAQTLSVLKVVSTDPPYYDNIGYADLSDFFYVWLRRSLRSIFPDMFATLAVPKTEELVATPYRHGGKDAAETFFLNGMTQAMHRLAEQAHPAFPITIYYAFKQSESENNGHGGVVSTGWEIFLDAVLRSGLSISGTWPMRTERPSGVKTGTNVLASSVILVCRPRPADAPTATRRDFLAALRAELPRAVADLQRGNIAPVDLAQAAIGPGMAVYTRYARVLDAAGKPLSVRDALALINATLDEALAEQEGDFDADSRFAIAWFEQNGFAEGEFGVADVLARAKNTSVDGLRDASLLESKRGKVRLLKATDLPEGWDPATDARFTHWEAVHHLIRALEGGGETAAAALVAKLGSKAETARELAYRLYTICERKKRAAEALQYNGLVQSFPEITRLASGGTAVSQWGQGGLFEEPSG